MASKNHGKGWKYIHLEGRWLSEAALNGHKFEKSKVNLRVVSDRRGFKSDDCQAKSARGEAEVAKIVPRDLVSMVRRPTSKEVSMIEELTTDRRVAAVMELGGGTYDN